MLSYDLKRCGGEREFCDIKMHVKLLTPPHDYFKRPPPPFIRPIQIIKVIDIIKKSPKNKFLKVRRAT